MRFPRRGVRFNRQSMASKWTSWDWDARIKRGAVLWRGVVLPKSVKRGFVRQELQFALRGTGVAANGSNPRNAGYGGIRESLGRSFGVETGEEFGRAFCPGQCSARGDLRAGSHDGDEALASVGIVVIRHGDGAVRIEVTRGFLDLLVYRLFAAGESDKAVAIFLFDRRQAALCCWSRRSIGGDFGARNLCGGEGGDIEAHGFFLVSQGFLDVSPVQLNG